MSDVLCLLVFCGSFLVCRGFVCSNIDISFIMLTYFIIFYKGCKHKDFLTKYSECVVSLRIVLSFFR